MNNLSLDKTLTTNPFLSVSSLHHSRTSQSLSLSKKSNKVLVFSDKHDNSSSITNEFLTRTHFFSKKTGVFACKDDNSSLITSGVFSRTHFSSKKFAVFSAKDDNSRSITSGVFSRTVFSTRKTKKVIVFASKDDSNSSNKLDQWDQMELKFGRLIGEDPKLTLAKVYFSPLNLGGGGWGVEGGKVGGGEGGGFGGWWGGRFLAKSPIKEHEDNDWVRAEELVKSGGRDEVELVSCSTRGFVVSFGSLIGFLPYRNLAARWKFLAFESWLRQKGLDPSLYKQGLGIIDGFGKAASPEAGIDPQVAKNGDQEISPDMKLEDLLRIYDQEKLKFLSSFVGQRIRVSVVLADRNSRRLIFSIKPKEKEELVEKKRSLMAKLQVGDVVKCCIQKITYFGIFVEVEGVPALIHQTEVSWDATLDPVSYFKIGQIVEAKVHQLDFSLERIFLSLKEITPDPMMEALEAVVGDHDNLNGKLQAADQDTEWPDVESLIKELQQVEGISSVSKGRYFLSPGLAPTFQVYMASMFENQYKLLARSGNKVQEVIVETSLGKEEMKSAIQSCTDKVE
ncbi:uncharacterized protein LOC132067524 [Lycium ferocissimum]|uniref:uncharacterized protein LOC132067524 n=1 Tax=Lycium ferocissimum TaxID=112874 RepID=UPI002816956B|nr:uncharacterized protein LOC132067524 [Lycium ferocissimum]